MPINNLKIAIVHDWLTSFAGAERVIDTISEVFPNAPIYTSVYLPEKFPASFKKKKIITSKLQKYKFIKHQLLFPFMGKAFEQFDFSEYDIVISSAHASAKGIITKPETLHICYCHTPTRYLWSHYHEYLNQMEFGFLNPIIKRIMPRVAYKLRLWDRTSADRVDLWLSNSKTVAKRIKKYYKKESTVVYPPVDTNKFKVSNNVEDYYLVCSRLIPYKKIDLVIETFNILNKPLKIIGTGSMEEILKKKANKNIEFLGRVKDQELQHFYSKAQALIFPQEEDFGIVPLESMASGRPVIAFNKGGATETIIPQKTGILFNEQTVESLKEAVNKLEATTFDPLEIRNYAMNFDKEIFKKNIYNFIISNLEKENK